MDILNEEILRAKELMGVLNEQGKKYIVEGSRFCFYGTCRLDVKVISVETGEIMMSKGLDGQKKTEEELYKELETQLNNNNEWKEFGVELPELQDFENNNINERLN